MPEIVLTQRPLRKRDLFIWELANDDQLGKDISF
jgi:hypothetical protein